MDKVRICEYCGAIMKLVKDEDEYLVFDCPNCLNTWYALKGENNNV